MPAPALRRLRRKGPSAGPAITQRRRERLPIQWGRAGTVYAGHAAGRGRASAAARAAAARGRPRRARYRRRAQQARTRSGAYASARAPQRRPVGRRIGRPQTRQPQPPPTPTPARCWPANALANAPVRAGLVRIEPTRAVPGRAVPGRAGPNRAGSAAEFAAADAEGAGLLGDAGEVAVAGHTGGLPGWPSELPRRASGGGRRRLAGC